MKGKGQFLSVPKTFGVRHPCTFSMKKILIIIGAVIVLFIFITIGAVRVASNRNNKDDDKIEVARRGEFIVKVKETGYLEPLLSVEIKSNVEGEIKKLYVKDGDYVEKEQILLKIDDAQVVEERNQAKANLDAAKAQLEQAKLGIHLTEQQQDSALNQAYDTVEAAKAAYDSAKALSEQRIAQADTEIATTENSLEQDKISKQQTELALLQAKLALQQYKDAEKSAKVALQNAESEMNRIEELYEKEFVARKTLEDAQTRYASALAQHQSAEKNIDSQKKAVESHEANIESRQKAIETRETTLAFQKQNLEAIKTSQAAQVRQAKVQLNISKTRLKQLQETTSDEKEISRYSEATAQANLLRTESRLKDAEERLKWTIVIAPMAGTITQLRVEEGEIVTSGRSAYAQGPAIMTVADLSKMVVKTYINEHDISKIKVGQKVGITAEAIRDKTYQGQVKEISPSGQQRENIIAFDITIEIFGSPKELRPGMRAKVDIVVVDKDDVLQLPIETVMAPETMMVKATVPEIELDKLEAGKDIKIENLAEKQFKGKISSISPEKTRENVEILIEKEETRGLRIGTTEIAIVLSEEEKITKIPAEIGSERKYFVMLDKKLSEDEKQKQKKKKRMIMRGKPRTKGVKTQIQVGDRNNSNYEILSGVKEGDRVFVLSIEELTRKK